MIGKRPSFKQGFFKVRNPQKYIGNINNIVYRSGWEKRFMEFLDTSPKVKRWNSEDCIINYKSTLDGRIHRYFMDFYLEDIYDRKYLIEVKPYAQTQPPIRGKNLKTYTNACITFQRNLDKWRMAKKICDSKGINFRLLTERSGAFL